LNGIDYAAQGKTSTSNIDLAAISTYNGSGSNTYTGGARFVGAYIGCTSGHLRLNPDTALFSKNNLMIVSLFERAPNNINYFTTKQANSNVMDAILAAHTAGQPTGSAIYFTADYDPTQIQPKLSDAALAKQLSVVNTYFSVIRNGLTGSGYKLGVYGPGIVLLNLKADNTISPDYTWLPTASFNRSKFTGENIDQTYVAHPPQFPPIVVGGVTVHLDTAFTTDFGQWSGASAVGYGAIRWSNNRISSTMLDILIDVVADLTSDQPAGYQKEKSKSVSVYLPMPGTEIVEVELPAVCAEFGVGASELGTGPGSCSIGGCRAEFGGELDS
jgi:hypothetical protein